MLYVGTIDSVRYRSRNRKIQVSSRTYLTHVGDHSEICRLPTPRLRAMCSLGICGRRGPSTTTCWFSAPRQMNITTKIGTATPCITNETMTAVTRIRASVLAEVRLNQRVSRIAGRDAGITVRSSVDGKYGGHGTFEQCAARTRWVYYL